MSRRRHNPAALGILPLLAVGAGAVTAAGALYGAYAGWKAWVESLDYEIWKKTLPPPNVAPAPAAPQTAEEMRTWTPADAQAAYVELWRKWQKTAIPYEPPKPEDDSTKQLLILAAVIVAAILLLRGFTR